MFRDISCHRQAMEIYDAAVLKEEGKPTIVFIDALLKKKKKKNQILYASIAKNIEIFSGCGFLNLVLYGQK